MAVFYQERDSGANLLSDMNQFLRDKPPVVEAKSQVSPAPRDWAADLSQMEGALEAPPAVRMEPTSEPARPRSDLKAAGL